jgi:hypothetical protein
MLFTWGNALSGTQFSNVCSDWNYFIFIELYCLYLQEGNNICIHNFTEEVKPLN